MTVLSLAFNPFIKLCIVWIMGKHSFKCILDHFWSWLFKVPNDWRRYLPVRNGKQYELEDMVCTDFIGKWGIIWYIIESYSEGWGWWGSLYIALIEKFAVSILPEREYSCKRGLWERLWVRFGCKSFVRDLEFRGVY